MTSRSLGRGGQRICDDIAKASVKKRYWGRGQKNCVTSFTPNHYQSCFQ